jgi:NTE family protein
MWVRFKIEAKDLSSIKAVTTRAFDILSANSNVQNLIFATGLLNQKIYAYTAHFETNKTKMLFFNGYEAAKKSFIK